ncbi:MAG: response regulator transcription factor [Verrucomicrobiota bacterium]
MGINKKTTVMVVDDNGLIRFGLIGAIDLESSLESVGSAEDADEAIELYRQVKPDVVTMDYRMPGKSGVDCTRELLAEFPDAKIILYSVYESEEEVWKAVQAGVKGYLTKTAGAVEDVMEAIHEVAKGATFFPASINEKIESRRQHQDLTPRELETLKLLGEGKSNKDIAEDLDIAPATVKIHIANIREKLGAVDRTQAVVIAYKRGILQVQ